MSIDTQVALPGDGLAQRLGGLTPSTWDRLAGRHFYSTSEWLGFCTADFGGESSAAVCYRDGEPVLAVPYVENSDSLFSSYQWHTILTEAGLPAPAPKGILVGPREGYQTHFLGSADATPDELATLIGQLREAAGDRPCVAMYVTTEGAHALLRAGITTTPVLLDADAWIELPESTWSGWEATLTKNRRHMVRGDVRRFTSAGYRIEQVPLTECWPRLGELASATQEKYGHDTHPDIELRSLRNHAECMGDAARTALLYSPDDVLLGFCLYYLWHGTVFLRWIGLDYSRLTGAREYFNITYYTHIQCAKEFGIRRIHAGVKSLDAKANRGGRIGPLWLVDLTENSALSGADDAIRRHNAHFYDELKAGPITAAAVDEDAWRPFI